jgi:hypothetical protein
VGFLHLLAPRGTRRVIHFRAIAIRWSDQLYFGGKCNNLLFLPFELDGEKSLPLATASR